MPTRTALTISATLAGLAGSFGLAIGADPAALETSLRIQSAHISRSTPEFNKRFPNRYYSYGDNSPGVTLHLLLSVQGATLLPLVRDAVSVETFVDDTYQSLLGPGTESSRYGQSTLSDDARELLFTVSTTRCPSEEASRVFVRGSVQLRLSHGQPLVASNQLALTIGQGVNVGPFHTALRSISDQGSSSGLSLSLAVWGDASRIQKVRVLDTAGRALSDEHFNRFSVPESNEGQSTAFFTLHSRPKESVTLEYTYLEKIEQVRVPYEAQVDIGVAKAGPAEPAQAKPATRSGARTWPPPRETTPEALPPRRAAFEPHTGTAAAKANPLKPGKAAVDLFSLTMGKPAPAQGTGVAWKNPPCPAFFASGFTIARLMLSVPGAIIISIPPDGITVTRFEDDKGGKLGTAFYRETFSSPYWQGNSAIPAPSPYDHRSPDGQQMLLNLSLATAPTPGATRCTLAGTIQARVARGISTNTTGQLTLRSGEAFTVGPFTGKIDSVRQTAPLTPAMQEAGTIEVWLNFSGPPGRLRSVEVLEGTTPVSLPRADLPDPQSERPAHIIRTLRLTHAPSGPVALRVRSYDSDELVEVPFELSTGIGL